MATLLELSLGDYKAATLLYAHLFEDELFVRHTCYNLQQTVEKILKYMLSEKGIKYKFTHDINELLLLLSTNNINYPDNLETVADTLTLWESKPRYSIDFIALDRQIQKVFKVCEELYMFIDQNYTPSTKFPITTEFNKI